MKEEEKKAIEVLKQIIEKSRDLREEDFYSLIGIHQIQAISTILNLIEKKDKEIEKYKMLQIQSIAAGVAAILKDSTKAKEDLEMLDEGWRIELEKKDKIIDLMAREIDTLYSGCEPCTLSFNIACKHIKCEQCIKKYFERKVEEDK